ncbi:uncharacterized protein LOC143305440 [Osmia lignaria lignaria]|uniref:uncharacterized protein LOC143305440 n=1 Tax=Osmia lignaria lignaria TaxID=1437193 RepID=UPI00402BB98D
MGPPGERKIAESIKRDRTSADTNRVSDDTRFSQINLQHCIAATDILHHRLVTRRTDIALIQKPWISKERIGGLDTRCGSLYYDATSTRPRACIFVKKEITALKLNEFCTADLSAVKVKLNLGGNTSELVICSAYLPYDSEGPPPIRKLRALIDHCANNGMHLVIGCDANSHHTVWGSTNTNGRGTALLEYLATTGLEILNKGSAPTFVTSRRQEVIDLTLGSAKVAQVVKHWQVRDECTLLDHRQITFNLTGDRVGGTGEAYRNPKATKWALYREGWKGGLGGTVGVPGP